MSSTTKNLNLHLTGSSGEDKKKLFEDWRIEIAGEDENSNMQIIDAAYGDLKDYLDNTIDNMIELIERAVDVRPMTFGVRMYYEPREE